MSSLNDLGFDPSRFKLGVLCRREHDYRGTGKSLRRQSSRSCVECQAGRESGLYVAEKIELIPVDDRYYLGRLCKRNHDWNGTGRSLRIAQDRDCVECRKVIAKKYRENHPELASERSKEWREANPDKVKTYTALYNSLNRERLNQQRREFVKTEEGKRKNREWAKRYRKTETGRESYRLSGQKKLSKRRANKSSNHSVAYTFKELSDHLELFDGACSYCQQHKKLTLDHFIPVSKGGSDSLGNLVPCCSSCNSSKRNFDPFEWYSRQPFFSKQRWMQILRLLGKTQENYQQIPLL